MGRFPENPAQLPSRHVGEGKWRYPGYSALHGRDSKNHWDHGSEKWVPPIGSLPFKYSHLTLKHDYGRKCNSFPFKLKLNHFLFYLGLSSQVADPTRRAGGLLKLQQTGIIELSQDYHP